MGAEEMAIVLEAVKTLDHGEGEVAEVPDERQGYAHEEKLPPSLRVREDGKMGKDRETAPFEQRGDAKRGPGGQDNAPDEAFPRLVRGDARIDVTFPKQHPNEIGEDVVEERRRDDVDEERGGPPITEQVARGIANPGPIKREGVITQEHEGLKAKADHEGHGKEIDDVVPIEVIV